MGKIVLEDFIGGSGYYKINLAYLNKEQVEEIEAIVSKWKPTDEDIQSCIAMCLTDANEQRFKDYGTTLKDCLAWLEKQGEQKPLIIDEGKAEMDYCFTKMMNDEKINPAWSNIDEADLNKDIDLEKEIELIKGDYEQVDVAWNNDFDYIAKYFFELGLKAQKGE